VKTNWWDELAPTFADDLAGLDPPATWVQLARMGRADTFPTDRHRTVYETWRERAGRHLTEAGSTSGPARSRTVTPIPKTGKARSDTR
jgi:hypothetical protein